MGVERKRERPNQILVSCFHGEEFMGRDESLQPFVPLCIRLSNEYL